MEYIINGKFTADRMQGIVRYGRELVGALDPLLTHGERVTLALPKNAADVPDFKHIRTERIGSRTGILWEQTDLRRYVKAHKNSVCINMCNTAPLFAQAGITVVHDIMYKVNPADYTSPRNRLSRLWHTLQYSYIAKRERAIITVSEFSKAEIEKHYPEAKGKITVAGNGWQHVLSYKESGDWAQRYPFLKEGEFYFSLSTLSRNKNGGWIIKAAKNNPQSVFAVAGKYYETEKLDIPQNVHMLGFISDEDACALIKHCRAFIHPSLYEGFGIPPLEALALGAEVISSNAASLPEVLGDAVHYIDPRDPEVDIEALLGEKIGGREEALAKHSWQKSAEILLGVMKNM